VILALAGGVGGARLAVGLAQCLSPRELAIVVNTGDDFEHLGLSICPDIDTVVYTLAGVHNASTGWGRADETWNFMCALKALGGEDWFQLGDRDLAMHVLRTHALRSGRPLSEVTRALARRLGVRHRVLPMSDTPVRTRVRTSRGELAFQDYFVRLRCKPRVRGFRFAGASRAHVPPALAELFASRRIDGVVICPSNPYVSVAPILRVPAIGAWLRARGVPVVAVSPIVGGAAIKGPAAKIMRELGVEPSALGIARYYGHRIDGWVLDRADAALREPIEKLGHAVRVTDTLMRDLAVSERLAAEVIGFVRALAPRRGR
jgi:LPPG:FO 2-phospho-L-lactate transferase